MRESPRVRERYVHVIGFVVSLFRCCDRSFIGGDGIPQGKPDVEERTATTLITRCEAQGPREVHVDHAANIVVVVVLNMGVVSFHGTLFGL